MSIEAQRVVVIQDTSRDICPSAIKWIIGGFPLQPGDVLTLVGILHQVNNPMGYKVKVDSRSMFGVNPKFISEAIAKKAEEYSNNEEIMSISKLCESVQVVFQIKVHAGASAKGVALRAIKNLKATWVILDRQMKKDKKYFMEKLPCGISRMKSDNTIEQLREPKRIVQKSTSSEGSSGSSLHGGVRYDEMIPGSKDGIFPHKPITPPKGSSGKEKQADRGKEIAWDGYGKSNDHTVMAAASTSSVQEDENTKHTVTETQEAQIHISPTGFQQKGQKESSPDEQQKLPMNNDAGREESPNDDVLQQSICSVCKNRRPKIGWKRDFSYAELYAATGGFSEKNFLSEGGFGSVYKGELNGMKIAVKQHKSASFQGEKEFKSEVNVLSKARHENLVMLLGSCSEGSRRLLVYEYVCNGSLDQHISQHSRRPLSWEKRMRIAMGTAKGLKYLHDNNIIHRDMRPNNILINHNHHVLLGDFGLARTQNGDLTLETTVVGTLGYLAPEYAECGKVSTKSDVYAFGVVLLQLITGLKTTDKALGGKSLVGWARPLLKERNYPDLIDPRILDSHDVHQLFWMVRVAEKCLSKDPQKRLTMDKVVYALEYLMENNKSQNINELSPARSDSLSSTLESSELEDDTSYTEETVSSNSMDVMNVRLPPSPPMPTISSQRSSAAYQRSFSSRGDISETEGRKETSYGRSRSSLLYSEMMI